MARSKEYTPFVPGKRRLIRRFRSEETRDVVRGEESVKLFDQMSAIMETYGYDHEGIPLAHGTIQFTSWASVPLLENRMGSIRFLQYKESEEQQMITCIIALPVGKERKKQKERKIFEVYSDGRRPQNALEQDAGVNEILLFQQIVDYAAEDYAFQGALKRKEVRGVDDKGAYISALRARST